jgi:hypothetical protein
MFKQDTITDNFYAKLNRIVVSVIITFFFLCTFNTDAFSGLIFRDDFNGFSNGWTPSVSTGGAKFYPGGSLITYEPSSTPAAERNNSNSWNGWIRWGNNTIEIDSTSGIDDTPCLKIGYEPTSPMNQVGLFKWLGMPGYKELYIRWYFKFDNDWRWGDGSNGSMVYFKTMRIWTGVDLKNLGGKSITSVLDFPYGITLNWQDDNSGSFSPHVLAKFVNNTTVDVPTCPSDGNGPPCNINKWWKATSTYGQLAYWTGGIDANGYFINNGKLGKPEQTWNCIEHHIKLRDNIGTRNAIYEVFINGIKIGEPDDYYDSNPYISADGGLMNWIVLADNGTGGQFWPERRYLYIDNFVVSTTPIGPIPQKP